MGDALQPYLESNAKWAAQQDAKAMQELSKGQSPKALWIGCSDSRVPETTLLGLQPGDVFVHRNIANIVSPTDLSCVAVIEFAVKHLKVQHVIVCGHSSCGGVGAALANKTLGKMDTWLLPLRELRMQHLKEWEGLSAADQSKKLVEANVKLSVEAVRRSPDVISAAKERGLTVHGVIYDLATGTLHPVNTGDKHADARIAAFGLES